MHVNVGKHEYTLPTYKYLPIGLGVVDGDVRLRVVTSGRGRAVVAAVVVVISGRGLRVVVVVVDVVAPPVPLPSHILQDFRQLSGIHPGLI